MPVCVSQAGVSQTPGLCPNSSFAGWRQMMGGVSVNTEKRAAGVTLTWLTHQVPKGGTRPLPWGTVPPGAPMPRTVTLVYLSLKLETEFRTI